MATGQVSTGDQKIARRLVAAAKRGEMETVRDMLRDYPSEVDSVVDGGTALMEASHRGHKEVVQLLLEAGASIDKKNDRGLSILHWAVLCLWQDQIKAKQTVEILLQKGADTNSVDEDGETPLFEAIRKGNTEVIELLINRPEIDLSIKNKQGQNVLHCAILYRKVDVVKMLLQRGAEINSGGRCGNTPLVHAIRTVKPEVIKLLINHPEINLSIKNSYGHNVLHCAILYPRWDDEDEQEVKQIVEMLLQAGVDVNSVDEDGDTPLLCAIGKGNTEVIKLLINHSEIDLNIKNKQGQNVLHCVILELNQCLSMDNEDEQEVKQIVEMLLQAGVDVNSVDNYGNTSLHLAVKKGHKDIIKLLISHPKMDFSIKNKKGWNALHLVVLKMEGIDEKEIVQMILEKGADLNSVDDKGNTSLHLAVKKGHKDIIKLLINHPKMDFSIKNKKGWNALHLVVLKMEGIDQEEVVQKMFQQGADINSVDGNGCTALDLAKRNGDREIIDLLIHLEEIDASLKNEKGFNALHNAAIQNDVVTTEQILVNYPYLKDSKIQDIFTALHIAALNGHNQVVSLLIEKGAQLEIRDNMQQTALHMAFKESHFSTVKLLITKGADVNSQDENGQTCLHLAIMNHSAVIVAVDGSVLRLDMDISNALRKTVHDEARQVMELLINHPKTDFSLKNKAGFNVLHLAALRGDAVAAASILGKNTSIINTQKENGSTALHIAALNGHDQVVALLIEKGAKLNIKNKYHHTPLHMAVVKSQCSTIHLLIRGGADCNVTDSDGFTCFHLAVKKYLVFTVTASPLDDTDRTQQNTKINQAKAAMQLLINHPNIDISLKINEGCNVLHLAARSRNVVATEIILAKHTEIINTQDKDSFTALHLAALNGHEEMASLLIEKGANLEARSRNQHTPLHMATMKSHLPVIELLLNHGADVNAENDYGLTCLHIAIMKHAAPSLAASLPVLSMRLDQFGNKDEKTGFVIVSFLVKKGADVTIENKYGFTAFDMITDPVKKEAFKMLVAVFS